jgi:homospermidine synthase
VYSGVRCASPTAKAQARLPVTHNESISIAGHFTLHENGKVVYRPTCHYAYHPCDDAALSLHEMAGAAEAQKERHILSEDDIVDGIDELGVLLYGHAKNAYSYAPSSRSRRRGGSRPARTRPACR